MPFGVTVTTKDSDYFVFYWSPDRPTKRAISSRGAVLDLTIFGSRRRLLSSS